MGKLHEMIIYIGPENNKSMIAVLHLRLKDAFKKHGKIIFDWDLEWQKKELRNAIRRKKDVDKLEALEKIFVESAPEGYRFSKSYLYAGKPSGPTVKYRFMQKSKK